MSSAFVTGASRGIGASIVQQLLASGRHARVVAAARTATASPALRGLQQQYGVDRLVAVDMDITDESSVEAAAAELGGGPCSLLVHGAAIMHPSGKGENTVRRLDQDSFSQVMNTNVIGPALLTKALFQQLRASAMGKDAEPSKIVAIGAGVGSVGTNAAGGWYSYRVSKTALNALMKNLAIEGGRYSVLTATLYPEMVDTAFAQPYIKGNPYPQLRTPDETAARMLELIEELEPASSGRFVNIWSKEDIPW